MTVRGVFLVGLTVAVGGLGLVFFPPLVVVLIVALCLSRLRRTAKTGS